MSSVISQPVLVLNRSWIAIGIKSVEIAIKTVCTENAEIVDPFDYQQYSWEEWSELTPNENEDTIATVDRRIKVPEVIVLADFDKVHSRSLSFNRMNLFERDRSTCQYCGKKQPKSGRSIDHVIPQCQGGQTNWLNCVTACLNCNLKKGGRTPKQAKMLLIREPYKPKWTPVFYTRLIKQSWGQFIHATMPATAYCSSIKQ